MDVLLTALLHNGDRFDAGTSVEDLPEDVDVEGLRERGSIGAPPATPDTIEQLQAKVAELEETIDPEKKTSRRSKKKVTATMTSESGEE